MKLGCPDTIKFKKLKMRLKLTHWQCVGLLESLWLFTARNAPDGDIGRHSHEDIAACLEWEGEPDQLINTLVDLHWLDEHPSLGLVVHDWKEHCPTWIKGREASAAKAASEDGAKTISKPPTKAETKTSSKATPKTDAKGGATIPYHSIPSHSLPSPPTNEAGSKTPAQPAPATNAKPADWGVVAERLKEFGVKRSQEAVTSAKSTGFNPLQVLALIDWLKGQPVGAYEPGVLVERLACEDASDWDAHENWPPPAAIVVNSDSSPYATSAGQQALAEKHRAERAAEHAKKAAEVNQLEGELGAELDALDDAAFDDLMSSAPMIIRQQLANHGRGRDSPIRGLLLKHLHATRSRNPHDER